MPNISVHIEGLDTFIKGIKLAPQIFAKRLQRAIEIAGNHYLAATKQTIRNGTGMWKPPIDTGFMWNNIFLTVTQFKAEIIPIANYAIYVHEGTSRMRARPFLEITERNEMSKIESIFQTELEQAMKEAANG